MSGYHPPSGEWVHAKHTQIMDWWCENPVAQKYLGRSIGAVLLAGITSLGIVGQADSKPSMAATPCEAAPGGIPESCQNPETNPYIKILAKIPEAITTPKTTTTTTSLPRPKPVPTPSSTTTLKPPIITTTTIPIPTTFAPRVFASSTHEIGTDVSWPNCDQFNQYPTNSTFGIVGVNGGKDFTSNQGKNNADPECFSQEVQALQHIGARTIDIYFNSGNPGVGNMPASAIDSPRSCNGNTGCEAWNYGYNDGYQSAAYAASHGAEPLNDWIDVETKNDWDYKSLGDNVQDIAGEIQGIHDFVLNTYKVAPFEGEYSTDYQWDKITGGWQTGLPEWYATGLGSQSAAQPYCATKPFSGGHIWFVQYGGENGIDQDYNC